jgi:hypothetical protein
MEPLCSHYLARKNERHPERRLPESKDRSDPLDLILRDGFPGTIVRCLPGTIVRPLHSAGELLLVEPAGAQIFQFGINRSYQLQFSFAPPSFELLLSCDRCPRVVEALEVHQ